VTITAGDRAQVVWSVSSVVVRCDLVVDRGRKDAKLDKDQLSQKATDQAVKAMRAALGDEIAVGDAAIEKMLTADVIGAIDEFRADSAPDCTRAEAIKLLISKGLKGQTRNPPRR
jgi:hypothetical protein